jgi:hypothetical protein
MTFLSVGSKVCRWLPPNPPSRERSCLIVLHLSRRFPPALGWHVTLVVFWTLVLLQGTFTPLVHAHAGRTSAYAAERIKMLCLRLFYKSVHLFETFAQKTKSITTMSTTSMLFLLIGCLLGSTCVSAEEPTKVPTAKADGRKPNDKKASEKQPKTFDAAIQHIVAKLSAKDKKRLRGNKKEDLIQYHHGWGTGIRNDLGLWGRNPDLLADCSLKCYGKKQQIHPDDASMIIEAIWTYLVDNPTK